jgi:tryptophanyl-tRNA synthetase
MSSSKPETAIYTTDSPEVAKRKVMNAYTGGRPTVQEQKRLGAEPDVCTVFWSLYFMFEPDDDKIQGLRKACKTGEILCGDCKIGLAEKVIGFLKDHQQRREEAKKIVDELFL